MFGMGLRNKKGHRISRNGWSTILNNIFYVGIIRIRKWKQTFNGIHKPLITTALFDRIQKILRGKSNTKACKHDFLFRRLLICSACGYALIGEVQKERIYYRCHTLNCPRSSIREDKADAEFRRILAAVQFNPLEMGYLRQKVANLKVTWNDDRAVQVKSLEL